MLKWQNTFATCNGVPQLVRSFKPGSALKDYLDQNLTERCIKNRDEFFLFELITDLKRVLDHQGNFDEANDDIGFCDSKLEKILNKQSFHLCQISDIVQEHTYILDTQPSYEQIMSCAVRKGHDFNMGMLKKIPGNPLFGEEVKLNWNAQDLQEANSEHEVTSEFLEILHSLPEVSSTKKVFKYEEIVLNFKKYVNKHRFKLIDPRNSMIIHCERNILGLALGVKAFCICQMELMVQRILVSQQIDEIYFHGDDTSLITISSDETSHSDTSSSFSEEHGRVDSFTADNESHEEMSDSREETSKENNYDSDDSKVIYGTNSFECLKCGHFCDIAVGYCIACYERIKDLKPYRHKNRKRVVHTYNHSEDNSNICKICNHRSIDAGFVHGKTVHELSCYYCAKLAYNTNPRCPYCRRRIEKIVKIYKQ